MNRYIATFHTHLAALTTSRALEARGVFARMTPVPRKLSSSCGTCVRYEAETPCLDSMDEDMERVVRVLSQDEYELIFENI